MNVEMIMKEDMRRTEDIAYALDKLLSEKPEGIQRLKNRWSKSFNAVFASMTRMVSGFFVSHIKTKEVEALQSYTRQLFWKTDLIEKIKDDYQQQNTFLLGYCHGINELIDSFESEISYENNDDVKAVLSSYKNITPILRVLEHKSEMSHKELAESIGTSESSLSNLMNKIDKYHIFDETRMGKNKYYSIAYPNGKEALRLIKEEHGISADGYTELLLKMIDALIKISVRDEIGKDYAVKECEEMILKYTTKPVQCRNALEQLALIAHSERVYYNSLIILELRVKEKVTVFTRDIQTEEDFYKAIIKNLKKNIQYQWFVTESDELNSIDKIKKLLFERLRAYADSDNAEWEKLESNMQCYMIPKSETKDLLGEIYDAVIYDEYDGYSCVDRTIKENTPYISMAQNRVDMFSEYARTRSAVS